MLVSSKWVRAQVTRRVPITSWLPRYTPSDALCDLVAGITVGLTLIPQAIAYAALAGLSPQYGLYSALAGSAVYIFFGTCKEVNIGPTALLSLLTHTYTHDTNPDMAVLLCFLSGCIVTICGLLQLGFLVEFVSVPVVAGFTSASAIIIASSQVKGLLGIQYTAEGFVDTWWQLFENIGSTRLWDSLLGMFCIVILLALRRLKDVKIGYGEEQTKQQRAFAKFLWFIATGRNAMVVIICAAIAYNFDSRGQTPFILTGKIHPGLPDVSSPPFFTIYGNKTHSFLDMCSHLGTGLAIVPIISILGNVAIAKAFANGAIVDATQEMFTLGLCNIAGSFVRSMPINGSFTRSAVNNASGVRTPLGGLYTGIMVILALSLLTPYFYFIPKATLSAVIICAVIFMVEVGMVLPMWKSNKRDLVPAFLTLVACLVLGVEGGILAGIASDIAFLLYFNARPSVHVEQLSVPNGGPEYVLVTPSAGLLFPAVDFVRETVTKAGSGKDGMEFDVVVVNCRHVTRADFTAAQGVQSLVRDLQKRNKHIVFHLLIPAIARILSPSEPLLTSTSDNELNCILKELKTGTEAHGSSLSVKLEMNQDGSHEINKYSGIHTDTKF